MKKEKEIEHQNIELFLEQIVKATINFYVYFLERTVLIDKQRT